MKIIEYKCDICKQRFLKQTDVMAAYFISYTTFELRTLPQETDNHICLKCIDSLKIEIPKLTQ